MNLQASIPIEKLRFVRKTVNDNSVPDLGLPRRHAKNAIVCLFALLPAPGNMGTTIARNHELEKREALKNEDKASIKDCDDDTGRRKENRKDAK